MLLEAVEKPIIYRWPQGEVRLEPGKPVELPDDRAQRLLEKAPGKVRAVPSPMVVDTGNDAEGSLVAVKISGSVVGEFWFCLSESEPFGPGDGLSIYRPSEMKALLGKGYGPDALQAIHRVKTVFDGKVVGH